MRNSGAFIKLLMRAKIMRNATNGVKLPWENSQKNEIEKTYLLLT